MNKVIERLNKLIQDDWNKRDETIARQNRQVFTHKLLQYLDKAEEKWETTMKIEYYEAIQDLEDILDNEYTGLSNEDLKYYVDEFKRIMKGLKYKQKEII